MTFFNFQEDGVGREQFQVSKRWWYFLAATIPLTALVFVIWIVWQKIRLRRFREEDVMSTRHGVRIGSTAFGQEFDEVEIDTIVKPQKKRERAGGMLSRFSGWKMGLKDPAQLA
jgi:hypothetical protein